MEPIYSIFNFVIFSLFSVVYDQLEVTNELLDKIPCRGHEVRIFDESGSKWSNIGRNLGLGAKVHNISTSHPYSLRKKVEAMLLIWLDQADQLGNPTRYPKKWSGLIDLLKDSELNDLAARVRLALLQLATETGPGSNN